MSSGSERDRPLGVIRQGSKVVGAVCIPDASDIFIKEFNHCYGQLRLEVEAPKASKPAIANNPHAFRLPTWFRHVWHRNEPDES